MISISPLSTCMSSISPQIFSLQIEAIWYFTMCITTYHILGAWCQDTRSWLQQGVYYLMKLVIIPFRATPNNVNVNQTVRDKQDVQVEVGYNQYLSTQRRICELCLSFKTLWFCFYLFFYLFVSRLDSKRVQLGGRGWPLSFCLFVSRPP